MINANIIMRDATVNLCNFGIEFLMLRHRLVSCRSEKVNMHDAHRTRLFRPAASPSTCGEEPSPGEVDVFVWAQTQPNSR
jgi:hypothetical protein